MNADLPKKESVIREPSMVDALIPLIFMIAAAHDLDRVVRDRCSRWPAAGGIAHECGGGSRRGAQEWPFLGETGGGGRKGYLLSDERYHDPAHGRGADRGLEYVRHDCHSRLLRHQIYRPELVLFCGCPPYRHHRNCHRQLLDDCGYRWGGIRRYVCCHRRIAQRSLRGR